MNNNRRYLLLLVICFGQAVFGQQKMVDSLVKELNAHAAPDTIRLQMLNDLAWSYRTVAPQKGLQTAEEAITLGKKLGDQGRLASAYNTKAWNYSSLGQDSAALTLFGEGLVIRIRMKDTAGMARFRYNMGIMYFNLSDYPKALERQQEALSLFKNIRDTMRMANCYNSIGLTYQYLSDYPRALESYLQTLAIYEKHSDKPGMAAALSNVGILYKNMKKLDNALDYQQKALAVYQQLGDKQGMANCLGNIGVVYDNLDNPTQSLRYYGKALEISRSIDYLWGIGSNLSNIGTAYITLGNYDDALTSMQQALTIWKQIGDRNNEAETLSELARIYMLAPPGMLSKHRIPRARRNLEASALLRRSLTLAREIHSPARQQAAWQYLAELHEKQKDFAAALKAYKQAALLRDSILNTEKEKEITRKELQYEFQHRQAADQAVSDKRQALAAAEIQRQRVIRNAIGFGATLLIITGSLTFIFYKKKRESEHQRRIAEMEMTALRAQMNPHFIFNSLNSISDFILRNDLDTADLYLTRFATLMRMVLENSGQAAVSLADDLKALETYMQLECLRMNNGFTYDILVDASVDMEMTLVPPLLLQPFVENSIWHGLSGKGGKGKIVVRVQKEKEMIYCTVEDNGRGRNKSAGPPSGQKRRSLGMKITASRLAMINKFEHGPASLEITDLAEGMKVDIRLPLETRI